MGIFFENFFSRDLFLAGEIFSEFWFEKSGDVPQEFFMVLFPPRQPDPFPQFICLLTWGEHRPHHAGLFSRLIHDGAGREFPGVVGLIAIAGSVLRDMERISDSVSLYLIIRVVPFDVP